MVEFPLQLIVLSIPSLIFPALPRRQGDKWEEVLRKLGWQVGSLRYLLSLYACYFLKLALQAFDVRF